MSNLSDLKKEKIINDYRETGSYEETAARNKLSVQTVKNFVDEFSPDKFETKCRIKAMSLINLYMDELSKTEKIKAAPLNQLASALGVMIDRFNKMESSDENEQILKLIKSIKE